MTPAQAVIFVALVTTTLCLGAVLVATERPQWRAADVAATQGGKR